MADQARPRFSYIPGLDGIRGIWVVVGPLLYHAATEHSLRRDPRH